MGTFLRIAQYTLEQLVALSTKDQIKQPKLPIKACKQMWYVLYRIQWGQLSLSSITEDFILRITSIEGIPERRGWAYFLCLATGTVEGTVEATVEATYWR